MTQPNPNREVELQRTLIDHVPQLEEEIEEVFSQLDEARAERAELQRNLEESQHSLETQETLFGDKIDRLESELAEARAENERLNQRLVHAVIVRDVEFWRNYADETCKNIRDAHAKVLEGLIREGRENEDLKAQVEELRAACGFALQWISGWTNYTDSEAQRRLKAALAKGEAG